MSKKIILGITLALLVLAGIVVGLEKSGKIDLIENKPKKEEIKRDLDKKAEIADDSSIPTASTQNAPNRTAKDTPADTSSNSTYSAPTTNDKIELSADKPNDQEVVVITKLHGFSDGQCKLDIVNSGRNYSQEAPIMFQREYSVCAGFTVPISELGAGKWQISLTTTSGGTSLTKNINYEVKP